VLDAGGGTILPGLVDSHTHTTYDPAVRCTILACGVTSVCDLGSEIDTMPHNARRADDGRPAARGFCAGSMLTVPGGLPDAVFRSQLNYEVTTPQEARAAVADLHARGADVIKVFLHRPVNGRNYPILGEDQVRAIVEEAHARELPVRAHVWDLLATDVALAGGVDVVEHGPKPDISPELMATLMESADPLSAALDRLAQQLAARKLRLERMVEQGVLLVPTLERWRWGMEQGKTPQPEADLLVALDLAMMRQFHELGGTLALGTDYNEGLDERAMVSRELAFYAQAGLSPMEVIEAATRHAARACGQEERLGTLEPGNLADVIVVDADSCALGNVRAVVVDGEIACRPEDGLER
jgi:imidazolonepropionase-like amidohydrolase